MKILVIGGTQFIGRHVVSKLLDEGHNVTLLNRGKTSPDVFSNLALIKADRQSAGFEKTAGLNQDWEAVIDLSAYFPKDVVRLLDALEGRIGRYIFCSTISAYKELNQAGPALPIGELSRLHDCTSEQAVDTSMTTYGQRKAECERVIQARQSNGLSAVILRPSIVYGAHDYTDRFAYWIWRASQEKKFLLPDDGLTITHRTYAPDLAAAFATCLTSREAIGNAYNIAETEPLNLRDSIEFIGRHTKQDALEHAVSVSSDRLLDAGIKPWSDLPLWIPQQNMLIDTFRSRRDLGFVSTTATVAIAESTDTFLSEKRLPKAGLSLASELELLKKLS